jgi:hypothetical protein
MKSNNPLGASPVPFIVMIAFACITFAQVLTASAQTKWDLNAVFADGGTATGTFTLNAGYSALTAWSIKVSADVNNPSYTALTYSNTTGGFQEVVTVGADTVYSVFNSISLSRGLALAFLKPLKNSGGAENLIANSALFTTSEEQIVFPKTQPVRFITSGSVTEVPVPEPGTMASFALGIVAFVSLMVIKQLRYGSRHTSFLLICAENY